MRHVEISRYDRSYHPLIAYRERFRHELMAWWSGAEGVGETLAYEEWRTIQCRFHKVGSFIIAQFHPKGPAEPIQSILSLMNFRAKLLIFGTRYSCIVARKGSAREWTQWDAYADATSYIGWMIGYGSSLPISFRNEKKIPVYWDREKCDRRRRKQR